MLKQFIKFLLIFAIFLIFGLFSYFYYIKPQREYIKLNTKNCISSAMAPINKEVNKGSYESHYSNDWFNAPLKKQDIEIKKCINNYNSLLFSSPEKNLLILSTNSMIDEQKLKIDNYKNIYINLVSENKKNADAIYKCNQLKEKYQNYQKCISNASKNGQFINNCEYPSDAMGNMLDCVLMGINF